MALFGHDPVFYDLLETQADIAHKAAQAFQSLAADIGQAGQIAQTCRRLEGEADELTHQLVTKADAKFVTPLDKDDLHRISEALDDVTDMIESAVARVSLYNITQTRPDLIPLTALLAQTTQTMREAVGILRHLKDHKTLEEVFVRVHEMENQSDQAYRTALASLFNEPNADPLNVLKWKDVYDRIEAAVDECENVADILEVLVVKYA